LRRKKLKKHLKERKTESVLHKFKTKERKREKNKPED